MPVPRLLLFPNLIEKLPAGLAPTGESGREQLACISLYPGCPYSCSFPFTTSSSGQGVAPDLAERQSAKSFFKAS